jgi:hypothetical protein
MKQTSVPFAHEFQALCAKRGAPITRPDEVSSWVSETCNKSLCDGIGAAPKHYRYGRGRRFCRTAEG